MAYPVRAGGGGLSSFVSLYGSSIDVIVNHHDGLGFRNVRSFTTAFFLVTRARAPTFTFLVARFLVAGLRLGFFASAFTEEVVAFTLRTGFASAFFVVGDLLVVVDFAPAAA